MNSFDRYWDKNLEARAEYIFDEVKEGLSRQERRSSKASYVKATKPQLGVRFGQRKVIQRQIHQRLLQELGGVRVLFDLFSGDAAALIPFAADNNNLRHLVVLDDESGDHLLSYARLKLMLVLQTQKPDLYLSEMLQGVEPGIALPFVARTVTLLETGLTLPQEARIRTEDLLPHLNRGNRALAPYLRSSHVGNILVDFADVLGNLRSNMPRELHVVDTPFFERPISNEEHRDYAEDLANRSGWELKKWTPLCEGSPSSYGAFSFEP